MTCVAPQSAHVMVTLNHGRLCKRRARGYCTRTPPSFEKPEHDKDQDDQEEDVDPLASPRDARDARRSEISEKPEDQQDDDQEFEQVTSLGPEFPRPAKRGEGVANRCVRGRAYCVHNVPR